MAGELPREAHNAPLHLFSAAPGLVGFGRGAYRRRSKNTSAMLEQLLEKFQSEGFGMSYTMVDFQRQYAREHFAKLTPEEQQEVLEALPPERRLAGLSAEQIRRHLHELVAGRPAEPRKPRRKKKGDRENEH